MKRCPKCGVPKSPAGFYSDRSRKDGLSNRCKPCVLADRAAYRAENREQLKAQAHSDRRRTPERGCWHMMLDRCYDEKNSAFHLYGGRGITVCSRWRKSFEAFQRDMGPRPSRRHSVDRINTDGNYEPGNCRWATPKEQARNMRSNRILTAFGKSLCVAAWAEETGIPVGVLRDRIGKLGWETERALSTPARRRAAA